MSSVLCNGVFTLLTIFLKLDFSSSTLFIFAIFLCFNLWKLSKVLVIIWPLQNNNGDLKNRVPKIVFKEPYKASPTGEHDAKGFNYMLISLLAIIVAYSCYSLIWEEHSGWFGWMHTVYSHIVLYLWPISMVPQIYVNYKFKTV